MAGVTKEEISRAKELDLLTYFKLVEPGNLKLVGKEYRHKVHSSLTISKDSLWCWHCIGLHGRTALKYLIDVEKVPYVEAVREINRIQGGVVHSSQPVSLPQPRAEPEAPRDFKLPKPDQVSLMAKYGVTEQDAFAMCRQEGLLSPLYEYSHRGGCWFCPNASMTELRHLYHAHPDLWQLMLELQDTPNKATERFNRNFTFAELDLRFRLEGEQLSFYDQELEVER